MTSSFLIGNSGSGQTIFFPSDSSSKRLIDIKSSASNRHDVSIVWLDTKLDRHDLRTQELLKQLNDRVELFNDFHDCLNYLQECQETILLIISGKCVVQCIPKIHSLSSIDSIIIYCARPQKYTYLINETYNKILACIATECELIQCVHKWIDLKCQTHFYTWNNKQSDHSKQLTFQTALFLANHVLTDLIQCQAYYKTKDDMLKVCRLYYGQRSSELDHIREFDLTYTSTDAIQWYTRDSFVHKIVNRTLRTFDQVKLRVISFYIQDLRKQLRECHLKTSAKDIKRVYHGLIMTQCDIKRIEATATGSLLSPNGFLSTSRKREVAMEFATKKHNTMDQPLYNVLLEINLDIENSRIIFADIGQFSAYPDESEILFDIGSVFCLQNVHWDEQLQFYIIKLNLATQNDYDSIKEFLKIVRYQLDEHTNGGGNISLIGKLLNIQNACDEALKKSDDHWYKFSLFRSAFKNHWHNNHDKYKQLMEENLLWIVKTVTHYWLNRHPKNEKLTRLNNTDLALYNEPSLARFEPVLFFCFNEKLLQHERIHLSSIFELQYRRFITKPLTFADVDENLNEFYMIYYVSTELPGYMENNPRIKFYQLKALSEKQDMVYQNKVIERLISQLLHDLGKFYPEQAESLIKEQENSAIVKKLIAKGAKCYRLLAYESEKTIQKYKTMVSDSSSV